MLSAPLPEDDPEDLTWLLQSLAARLPTPLLMAVLQRLPCVVVARLTCVHKAYHTAWEQLRALVPRWAPPIEADKAWLRTLAPLSRAAWVGDDAAVARLLAMGGDVLAAATDALQHAVLHGHDVVVAQLLAAGADVHADGDIALRLAARLGCDAIVAQLLAAGADVRASNGYADALGDAALEGHDKIVARLLAAGADARARDSTALCCSAFAGHDGVVAQLLAAGADVNARNCEALR